MSKRRAEEPFVKAKTQGQRAKMKDNNFKNNFKNFFKNYYIYFYKSSSSFKNIYPFSSDITRYALVFGNIMHNRLIL